MNRVTSSDGTTIAFDRLGDGPPLILVCGGSTDRTANAPLAELLAQHFTVFNYDRRGRGDSGDTAPYAVEREVEDIDAVIADSGGSAFLYGTSSGAALALEAAASGLSVTRLALWEPPYILEGRPRPPADTARTYTELVSAGRRGDAVEFFMTKVVGLPPEFVAYARTQPFWKTQEALAHTLAYDATIMGDYSLPTERVASVTVPTLVIDGGASFPFMRETAQALADVLPDGHHRTLEGQTHDVAPEAMAPVLAGFFAGEKEYRGDRIGVRDAGRRDGRSELDVPTQGGRVRGVAALVLHACPFPSPQHSRWTLLT
jgi:pimeloyl-ACP methyl ester carboxylesterase